MCNKAYVREYVKKNDLKETAAMWELMKELCLTFGYTSPLRRHRHSPMEHPAPGGEGQPQSLWFAGFSHIQYYLFFI